MRPIFISIAAGSLLATLATAQTPRYTVTDLGTLGGAYGEVFGINNTGRTAGSASLPNGDSRAFLSVGDSIADLGALGGPNSWEGGLNASYQLAIFAETSKKDPLGNDFCGFGTNLICLPAIWNETMMALPTLGGNNGAAFAINNQGQLAGVAENGTKDANCVAPQVLDFEAALWGPGLGQVQVLPPLPGDTVGFANWLNNYGQAVGASGTCANTGINPVPSGPHAVLWQNGSPINLGNLGGSMDATAAAINDFGEVAGESDLASELPGFPFVQNHAFLWTKAVGMQDIGTVGKDFSSISTRINNNGQVVGLSCDIMGNCRAFLWQNNAMLDLNALIPANSPLYLMHACAIDDSGVIAGMALQISTGAMHAFVATPIPATAGAGFESSSPDLSSPMVLPDEVRKQLQQRLGLGRLGAGRTAPR